MSDNALVDLQRDALLVAIAADAVGLPAPTQVHLYSTASLAALDVMLDSAEDVQAWAEYAVEAPAVPGIKVRCSPDGLHVHRWTGVIFGRQVELSAVTYAAEAVSA